MKLKRSLGQNFLTDSFFLEKIVQSSQIQKLDDVIEIILQLLQLLLFFTIG